MKIPKKVNKNSKSPKTPLDNKKKISLKLSGKARKAGAFKNFIQDIPSAPIDQKDPKKVIAKRRMMKRIMGV